MSIPTRYFDNIISSGSFSGSVDKCVLTNGCQIYRTLSYGTNWNHIRIGALVAISPSLITASLPVATQSIFLNLALGIALSTDTGSFCGAGDSGSNFLGLWLGNNEKFGYSSTPMLYAADNSSSKSFYYGQLTMLGMKNGTIVDTTSYGANACIATTTGSRKFPIIVDISKSGSSAYSVVPYYLDLVNVTASAQNKDYTENDLIVAMTTLTASTTMYISNVTMSNGGGGGTSLNGTGFNFSIWKPNVVNLMFESPSSTATIYALIVNKLG